MAKTTVVIYPWADELIFRGPQAANAVREAAKVAAEAARTSTTPNVSGDAVDNIVVGGLEYRDGIPVSFFGSKDFAWHIIEFGSENNQPYRSLSRAVEQVGLTFEPEPR